MITDQNAHRRPAAFNSRFGFSVAVFDTLFREFEEAHQERLTHSEVTRKNRRTSALPIRRALYKARRNRSLTDEQKASYRFLSSYRIVVEHTNAQRNVFQVSVQTYRHCRQNHGQMVRIVAGLVNRQIAKQRLKSYAVVEKTNRQDPTGTIAP